MNISFRFLLRGAVLTMGTYGLGQIIRLGTNVLLAHLLAPELFGVMLIIQSVRMGIELLSDVGIGQNIVVHKDGNEPEFYNTAWTIQIIRGVLLWLVTLFIAVPVANFYELPILKLALPLTTFGMVLGAFTAVTRELLQKRLMPGRLNAFEMSTTILGSSAAILFAFISPTIWAFVFSGLFTSALTMIGSYFLLPDVKHRFQLSKHYTREILHFGKWIFFASAIFFASTNFDRLYLAKAVPLQLLGVYGIARSISEMLGLVVSRFGSYVLFPLIASHAQGSREELRKQLAPLRARFLLAGVLGFSLATALADIPVRILYDARYQAASWMLPVLVLGSWFSILAYINEAMLLGLGKPSYSAAANALKFVFLLAGLPLSFNSYGLIGCILVLSVADVCRYIPILLCQRFERFSFTKQDIAATVGVLLLVGVWEWLRWMSGFGTSFDTLPIDIGTLAWWR